LSLSFLSIRRILPSALFYTLFQAESVEACHEKKRCFWQICGRFGCVLVALIENGEKTSKKILMEVGNGQKRSDEKNKKTSIF
jgi:hypothetical protein